MFFRQKMTTIYQKKDRDTWRQIRKALKQEGIRPVRAGHYYADPVGINGIGGMVDPRDFGVGHPIDRDIYFIEVRVCDAEAARRAILKHGLVAAVDSDVTRDAPARNRRPLE